MKLENHDLEKIEAIVSEAAEAAELPFILAILKKDESPQFEVRVSHPSDFGRIKEKVFLPNINPLINGVYQSQLPAYADDLENGFKNIVALNDVISVARPARVKAAGACPLVIEKDVIGFLLFAYSETNPRVLKIADSFARQIASYLIVKNLQQIAHNATMKSQTMMESSQDAFFTIDTQGGHVHVSPNLEEMTGYPADEFLQGLMKPEQYVVADDLQKVSDFYRVAFTGQKASVEFRMKRKDGNVIWFAIGSNPIFDSAGKLVAIQGIGRDISEKKKATWELEKTKEREQLKTEFMSVISHELRTPLTPIQGYTDALLGGGIGELTAAQKEALTIIKKQSKRLLNLIDSVLDITRVEYGKPIDIKKEPVCLNDVILEVIDGMKFQFKEKEIKVTTELSPDVQTVLADEAKITRVVSNILSNSLKFTPKKGAISVTTKKVGADVEVVIADSGVGIEQEHRQKIFEKFYQVDTSYTRSVGGIGMGLTIVSAIVEGHGGKVWAESDGLGKGARFIFTLPLT